MKKRIAFFAACLLLLQACILNMGASAENTTVIGGGTVKSVSYLDSLDIFALCGSDGIYTSTAASDWTVRGKYRGAAVSFAYSDAADTGVIVDNGKGKTPVLTDTLNEIKYVYNLVDDGSDSSVIYLRNTVCYDPFSKLFWAAGAEYDYSGGKAKLKRVGLYYSDGRVLQGSFNGENTDIMLWKQQENDFYHRMETEYISQNAANGTTYAFADTAAHMYRKLVSDGAGHIIGLQSTTTQSTAHAKVYAKDARRYFSIVTITRNGENITTKATAAMFKIGTIYDIAGITYDGKILAKQTANNYFSAADADKLASADLGLEMSAESYWSGLSTSTAEIDTKPTYKNMCMLPDRAVILSSGENIYEIPYHGEGLFGSFARADGIMGAIGGHSWQLVDCAAATGQNGVLCFAFTAGASIVDIATEKAVTASRAGNQYAYIEGGDAALHIKRGTSEPHGLTLKGEGAETTDAMYYKCFESQEAKYQCDLDGIDVSGIYAWEDADLGTYSFVMKAYSAEYPSITKTVSITVNIEE